MILVCTVPSIQSIGLIFVIASHQYYITSGGNMIDKWDVERLAKAYLLLRWPGAPNPPVVRSAYS